MERKKIIILGGGLSGLSAAYFLSERYDIILVEKERELGGLAASFEKNGKKIPICYHHILSQDENLIKILKELDVFSKVKWKYIKIYFWMGKKPYNFANIKDFLRFPLKTKDKIKFAIFMSRCFAKKKWDDMGGQNAEEWLDSWANKNIREKIFEPLVYIKFGMRTKEISASWLGSRLSKREGSSKFGYIPSEDWTHILVKRLEEKIILNKGKIIKNQEVNKIIVKNNKIIGIKIPRNKIIKGDILISTVPPVVFKKLLIFHNDKKLAKIKYISTISCTLAVDEKLPNFYWMNFLYPRLSFGGIFQLTNLNPTLYKDIILNIFTNTEEDSEFFKSTEQEIIKKYKRDFKKVFGFELNYKWYKIFRIANSSPKFLKEYENPPIKGSVKGIYFAGNYMTYQLVTSTGSAILSGRKTAEEVIKNEESN